MTDTFDFNAAPAPPANYTPRLQWNHSGWDKVGKHYVSFREVRESYLDCLGFWPLLDERHRVPVLLDRATFVKYCYYAETREDLQADDTPEGYVPISYEADDEAREEWRKRQLGTQRNIQYYSSFIDMALSGSKDPVKSKKNQYYIKAVKACRPDAIQALFDKGTDSLDANCFGGHGKTRRGVLGHALDNLYAKKGASNRSKALECLRLVCSLDGVDVNLDTWYASSTDGPPLAQAVKKLDVEAVRILLDAGARPTFPDAVSIDGQWCNVVKPPFPEHYQTALQQCVGMSKGSPDVLGAKGIDEAMSAIIKLLLAAGKEEDILVEVQCLPDDPDSLLTALDFLEMRQDSSGENYPLSMAILKDAETRARTIRGDDLDEDSDVMQAEEPARYQPKATSMDLKNEAWAQITDLDETMQREISQYADIYQWGLLKQTSNLLSSWPKPPPPPIAYHLISFHFSNQYDHGYCGVAKTLSAVLDAFKHMGESDEGLYNGDVSIDVQFIIIGDVDQPVVPLLQYRQSEYYGDPSPADIHPYGSKHFGVEEAGKNLDGKSAAKRMMNMELYLYQDVDDEAEGRNLKFDKNEAAFLWFEGMKPSQDIDLRHLWQTEGSDEEQEEEMYEIWLNKVKAVEPSEPYMFTVGQDGEWAVCEMTTNLWDRY